jgi:hypothetical protein
MRIQQTACRAAIALLAVAGLPALAAAQMPDARQMSGIPMPTSDAPAGTVSVRLVRGELTNNIVGHPVELHGGARAETVNTDQDGRAIFKGVQPGASVHAVADVDGQRIESQTFSMPPDVGVRLVLVAGGSGSPAAAASPAAEAAPGDVVFAGDSRIQIEFDDDTLEVFYLLDLVNPSSSPVNPKGALVFELPAGAQQAATLEGASPQVTVRGRAVSIMGPIPPGSLPVHLAFSLAPAGADRTIVQQLPAAWAQVQVIMTTAGAARISSPQFASASTMAGSSGQPFILGTGGALPANQDLTLTLSGLPSRSRWGHNLAIAIAALILLAGAWAAMSARAASGDASRRAALLERRDRLMADLVRTEEQHRSGMLDEGRYGARHEDLVAQLERVYGELDRQPGATAEV